MIAVGLLPLVLFTAAAIATPALAWSQGTRDEERAAEQGRKAADLHPYEPTPLERRIAQAASVLTNQPPVYAFIGSVYRSGALAVGPGVRQRTPLGFFDAHGAWSLRNYKRADVSLRLPEWMDRRVTLETHASWLDAPKVPFFGTGPDTPRAARASYLYRTTTVGASGRLHASRLLTVGSTLDYLAVDSGPGRLAPSVDAAFSPATAPGLGADPTYVRSQTFAAVDSRQSPGYTNSGALYRVDWSAYHQTNSGQFSFQRLDAEVNQFVPLLHTNWVLAFRALASMTTAADGNQVPYFMMPDLGGASELRGYSNWRFRDRHRLLLTGEYRWTAGQFVDMALFVDAGKVTASRSDLDFTNLRTSYGIGVRFHTPLATLLRIELARASTDGVGLVFAVGPSF
jgi:hypothetical protein